MPLFDSSSSQFFIDDTGGTERDLSAYLTDVGGLPGSRSLVEVTSFSDTARRFVPAAHEGVVTLRGVFDGAATSGPDAVLAPLLAHTSPVDFAYYPRGKSPTSLRYSGKCWVERYDVTSALGSRVAFAAKLRIDGTLITRR